MKNYYNNLSVYALSFKTIFIIFLVLSIISIIYVYSTKFKKTITIDEKYTYGSNNSKGNQSISDTNNNIYIVQNSLYLFHWTSVELFNKMDVGKTYEIEGYGYRVPFLGLFPNIVKAKEI